MMTVIAIVHIIFCLLLIALVLLQDPKSSGAGGVFGSGGANTVLGATGGATFLTKLTRYSAVVFGITCIILTLLSRPNTGSVLDSAPANAATAPTAPLEQPAAPNGATDTKVPEANQANPAPAEQKPAGAPDKAAEKPAEKPAEQK